MHACQIVTVLGLCLSQIRAIAVPPVDEAIKSFVTLVTQPDAALENSPGFSRIADSLHQQHDLNHAKFHNDLIDTVSPILQANDKHTPYILDSFFGYRKTLATKELDNHPKVKARRLQIYQDALYSELHRLANQNTEKFNADTLQDTHNRLLNLLNANAGGHHSAQTSPQKILEEIQGDLAKSVTSTPPMEFHKLTRKQINQQLEETNIAGVPDALPINGELAKKMLSSELRNVARMQQNHPASPAVTAA
ncbi:uncharacterized protein PGTG_08639 [Puccinia graminis f. sp. tritici CRL 75-36-700-3]|uniref:Uncharacterized protein n=1 Tax=Puccinia graminis f. sp. tritici (strain CRL 75-36-700-3 / race SCCL) TaxID=418459 RepID=E3KGM8_PUCGT|nr:uncharacterized protein PGTG_08639 [Puccinia graminis f. sp. tritici CRL 75-36-700-3]EFP83453.1 hypothetical protein PGTG_08639 [Puccinia graminis f. sp. tritici CRL 75-36-700-3]